MKIIYDDKTQEMIDTAQKLINERQEWLISEFDKSTKKMLSFLKITETKQTEETGRAEILQSKFNNTLPENEL